MPKDSSVYCYPIVQTRFFSQKIVRSGDIDLLIVPYENNELVLHRTVVIEIKVIRSSFARQSKSPNNFGFSQASGLMKIGFPYVAVAHLIISDESPKQAWRKMGAFRIIDSQGHAEALPPQRIDCLPVDLIGRAFGRLLKAGEKTPEIGLIATYIGSKEADITGRNNGYFTWYPECRRASLNPNTCPEVLKKVACLFEQRTSGFLDNPRFDPS